MAKVKAKAGDLIVEFNDTLVKDARFLKLMARVQGSKVQEADKVLAFYDLCDFLFGEENTDVIMDELAKDNDGVCTPETLTEWVKNALSQVEETKKS